MVCRSIIVLSVRCLLGLQKPGKPRADTKYFDNVVSMIHSDDNPAIRVSWLDRKAAESTSQHFSAITHEQSQGLVAGIARPHKNIEQPVECTTRLPQCDAERNGTLDERDGALRVRVHG